MSSPIITLSVSHRHTHPASVCIIAARILVGEDAPPALMRTDREKRYISISIKIKKRHLSCGQEMMMEGWCSGQSNQLS